MTPSRWDALALHAAFGAACLVALVLPGLVLPTAGGVLPSVGWRVLGLVALYHLALLLVARRRGHADWLRLWAFLVPLSAFMVVPDAVLADLGVLVFPETGGRHPGAPRVLGVPLALAGMWAIPLFVALLAAQHREDWLEGALVAAVVGGAVFVGAEATLWAVPIWETVGVAKVGPVALFVIGPELGLGASAYLAERWTRGRSVALRMGAAAACAAIYLLDARLTLALIDGI